MTPTELTDYARQRYNAVGDAHFADGEMRRYIWQAQMELAKESLCIRSVYTTSTVASQQEYSFPTSTISIKRITIAGNKIEPRSLEEVLDLSSSVASPTGASYIYAIWNEVLYLAPIPDAVYALKIFSVNEPQEVTTTSILEVPSRYHLDLAEFINEQMTLKDKNYQGAALYTVKWKEAKRAAKVFERKMLRGQQLSFVKDADRMIDMWGSM